VLVDVKGAPEEMRATWLLIGKEASWRNVARVNGPHSQPRDLAFSLGRWFRASAAPEWPSGPVKTQSAGPPPWFLIQWLRSGTQEFAFLNKFPDDASIVGLGTTVWGTQIIKE